MFINAIGLQKPVFSARTVELKQDGPDDVSGDFIAIRRNLAKNPQVEVSSLSNDSFMYEGVEPWAREAFEAAIEERIRHRLGDFNVNITTCVGPIEKTESDAELAAFESISPEDVE